MEGNKLISIENSRFIFRTNFEGNPEKDKYNSSERKGNLVIPYEMVEELTAMGVNVKATRPREEDDPETFVPTYYVVIKVNYNIDWENLKPKIYLVTPNAGQPVMLSEETVQTLDVIRVGNVDVTLNPREWTNGDKSGVTLWVRTMYVTQSLDDDPFADKYFANVQDPGYAIPAPGLDEQLPFN